MSWFRRIVPDDKIYVLWAVAAAIFVFLAGVHLSQDELGYLAYDLVLATLCVYLTWIHYAYYLGGFDDGGGGEPLPLPEGEWDAKEVLHNVRKISNRR